jgi:hypothetical protein
VLTCQLRASGLDHLHDADGEADALADVNAYDVRNGTLGSHLGQQAGRRKGLSDAIHA